MRALLLLLAAVIAALALATATPSVTPARTPTATPEATATSAPTATATVRGSAAPASPTPQPTAAAPQPTPTLVPSPTPVPLDTPELRGVWVDAFHDGFKTPEQVDRLLAWARSANLNALFVQVRRRGDAYYLKSFEPRSEDPDLQPGFDALQYLIDRAHQGPQRIQVHAWLATLPIWGHRDTPPLADNHVFNQHGPLVDPADSWLMYRDDGATWAGSGPDGIYYLDPGNPDAARYTTDVYLNVVRNYDVDGIHLDQVRYYEGGALHWGYNPASVARFNQRFGRAPESQPASDEPDWIAWRREQVSALVRRIYLETKAIKPRVAVSAAVVTWGKGPRSAEDWERQAPYAAVLQDWRSWLQEGSLDFVVPMNYYRETSAEADGFDAWTRWQAVNRGRRSVVVGLGAYLNSAEAVESQLSRARALGTLGVALYSYAVPTRDLEDAPDDARGAFADELRSTFFARPAPVPELPVGGGVLVEIAGHQDASVVLQDSLGLQHAWRTDATGVAGGLDLPPGSYTLRVDAPGVDATPVQVQIGRDGVTVVRYAPGM